MHDFLQIRPERNGGRAFLCIHLNAELKHWEWKRGWMD
jgi:hypothetical protein